MELERLLFFFIIVIIIIMITQVLYSPTRRTTSSTDYENATITHKVSKRFTPLYLPPSYAIHIRVSYKKTGFWVVYYLHVHVQKDRPDDHIRRYVPSSETQVREKRKKTKKTRQKREGGRSEASIHIYNYLGTLPTYLKQATSRPDFHYLLYTLGT